MGGSWSSAQHAHGDAYRGRVCPLGARTEGAFPDVSSNLSFFEQQGARPALLAAGAYSLLVFTLLAHDVTYGTFWCPLSQCEALEQPPPRWDKVPGDIELQRLLFSLFCLALDAFVLLVHWTRPVHPKFVLSRHRRITIRVHLFSGTVQCLCGPLVYGLLHGGADSSARAVVWMVVAFGYLVHVPTALLLLVSAFGAVRIMIPGFLHATVAYMYLLSRLALCSRDRLAHEYTAYWLGFHVYAFNRAVFGVLTKFNVLASARYTTSILLGLAIALPAAQGWAAIPLLVGAVVVFNMVFSVCMDKEAQATTDRYSAGGAAMSALMKAHFVAPEGLVTAPELGLAANKKFSEEERARIVFDKLDEHASGKIDLAELGDLLVSWGLPRREAEQTMGEYDTNKDGALGFREFYVGMRPVWEFAARIVMSNDKQS